MIKSLNIYLWAMYIKYVELSWESGNPDWMADGGSSPVESNNIFRYLKSSLLVTN